MLAGLPAVGHADEPAGGVSEDRTEPSAPLPSKTDLLDPFAEPSAPPAESSPPVAEPSPPQDVPAQAPARPAAAQTTLAFRNDAGNAFALSEARFVMDGKELPTVITNPERGKPYMIYSGPVAPGRHVVTVRMVYQGRSRGAFSYMKGYKLNVASDEVFTTPEDRAVGFTIVSKEQKGINVPLEKRIAVGVEDNQRR
ncbi:MAG TPA: hypothetical protein VFH73_23560 [Polyangia bacterium]|jgi:hypothetical protein|nr:hypothetical protein [Polyangia bacterium]